jgi:spore coat protein H
MCKNTLLDTFFFVGCLWLLAGETPLQGKAVKAKKPSLKPAQQQAFDGLFLGREIPEIKIEINAEGLAKLRSYQWQMGAQTEREAVPITVREGETTYTNVALHLKGAAGSFRSVEDNPAMTLNFDRFSPGRSFHGLRKLSLNNSVQDPTYTTEALCRELFLKAGIPVPRAAHARVELNGRDLGLYVLVEGWDKQFLKRHFKNATGNLYDGGFVKDVNAELTTNAGDPKNQNDRLALCEAAMQTNLTVRVFQLEKTLDIDRFLTYLALEVMIWDWDGYPMNRNNWRLYHDTDQDKMIFLPHGMDQMFWKPEGSLFPPMEGLVAKAFLEVPACRERYFARIKELRRTVFDVPAMTNRVQEIAAKIFPVLAKQGADAVAEHRSLADRLCWSIATRGASIDRQLETPIEPLKFDAGGIARLEAWQAKPDFGHPTLLREVTAGTKESLKLGTVQGSSIGSWRTRVWLGPGRYRLEGQVKTDGLVGDPGDPRAGAGFRTGNSRPDKYLLGTSDWKPMNCEFSLQDPLSEIQIVCDFRGAEGQAWFDLESLHLKRLGP